MKIRGPEIDMNVGEFEAVTETKYLGITVGGRGRNIFERENNFFFTESSREGQLPDGSDQEECR